MAEEHRLQSPPEGHLLCANNCGFFGSPATLNLCSKCYRDFHLKEEQASTAKIAVEKSFASSSSSISTSHLSSPTVSLSAAADERQNPVTVVSLISLHGRERKSASSAVSKVPSQTRAARFESRISAAHLPQGLCRTPLYLVFFLLFSTLDGVNKLQPKQSSILQRGRPSSSRDY